MTQAATVTETTIFAAMKDVSDKRVSTVLGQITKAISARAAYELEKRDGAHSKDFERVTELQDHTVARFFAAVGVNPEAYINSPAFTPEEFERKSRIPAEAKTGNLKAYKKMRETAEYFANGARMERVLMTFVACSIISSRYHLTIPRDVCERFLNSIPLNHVSDELSEALDDFRAKHMTGGAPTQTSQCTLQLATMRAARVVKSGRRKDFSLDLDSPVTESFAQRFGMVADLEKARAYRASLEAAA